ncbi:MAG TPA: hypothetical protein VK665_16405 [Candidatus Elarobacter sp.]|nr:hypothetical protein [Candidatus Elarobacter sp.]
MLAVMAASIVMPVASSAYQPVQCATCGDNGSGGKFTAGCNGAENSSSSGDATSFETTDDPMDDVTGVSIDVGLSGPGNWNMGYNWQAVDNNGNTVGTGTISPPAFNVPADGGSYVAGYSFSVPRIPTGGSLFVNASGVSDYGATVSGEGQTMNVGCSITF